MPELTGEPTWAQCRSAAESIELSEYGREAVALLRPRGPFGVIRRRGPIALQLYVAARDELLIWREPDSLALLRPPAEGRSPRTAPGTWLSVLRQLERKWDTVLFAGPALGLLAAGGVAALVVAGGGGPVAVLFGLVFALAAMLHVAVLMVALVVTAVVQMVVGLFRPMPTSEQVAAELEPGRRWTLALCHHLDERGANLLLGRVERRLEEVLVGALHQRAAEDGVEVRHAVVTETLVVLRDAGTTETTREALRIWAEEEQSGSPIALHLAHHRPDAAPARIFEAGGFLAWYVGGGLAVLAMVARFVADWERKACAADCAQRPDDYWTALKWLLQRLLLSDPYGISPATHEAWTIGWLTSLMSVVGLFVAVAALQQYLRARRARHDAYIRGGRRRMPSHTMIMVATDEEYRAVSAAVHAVNGREPEEKFLENQAYTYLGPIEQTRISLAQVEPGTVGPGRAAIAAAALVTQLDLDFMILAGICYGLRPGKQALGDVLVCTQLRAIDLVKVTDPPGGPMEEKAPAATEADAAAEPYEIERGDRVTPSMKLLSALRTAARRLDGPFRVHFGPMLTANKLVNSRTFRDKLARNQLEALGGEMEGAGVYAAAAHAKVDWIVVKGICDWGFDKNDDHHKLAADNAAAVVVKAATLGALDRAPARGFI
ncbi:hypothetical protein [Actinoplanes sp. NPDC026670]|uniref:5'-methylthioadenosine/S-adenosylhomocysteine nucleosidase family protein n=1 Tax=Actinoplanes sp. NPDC026670 TaxID=3154700 RepID=UPI00340D7E87